MAIDITQTPSWPQAQAAKAAWEAAFNNPETSEPAKAAAKAEYAKLMDRCLAEATGRPDRRRG